MDLQGLANNLQGFDLLVVVYLVAAFVVGYIQGTIRRVLGIASMLFSFLLAANVRDPLGQFLASNWHQFPREYSYMIGFLAVFLAATIAFSLTIQGFYKTQPLFDRARFVDEVIGGLLGVLQAIFFLGAIFVILDSFYGLPGVPVTNGEIPALRQAWQTIDGSQTGVALRDTLVPAFMAVFGFFIPDAIRSLYRGTR